MELAPAEENAFQQLKHADHGTDICLSGLYTAFYTTDYANSCGAVLTQH